MFTANGANEIDNAEDIVSAIGGICRTVPGSRLTPSRLFELWREAFREHGPIGRGHMECWLLWRRPNVDHILGHIAQPLTSGSQSLHSTTI